MTLGILEVWREHANMAPEKVADMTIEELKTVIAEVVAQELKSQNFDASIPLTEEASKQDLRRRLHSSDYLPRLAISDLLKFYSSIDKQVASVVDNVAGIVAGIIEHRLSTMSRKILKQLPDQDHTGSNQRIKTPLPQRTEAEQLARNLAVIELLREWREEGNEEEERESFENLKRALDEDRLSDRPLFPHK
jgi:hypothetical protein